MPLASSPHQSSEAHSLVGPGKSPFSVEHREASIPYRVVLVAASLLAFNAGLVNSVMLSRVGLTVSHVSGTSTHLGLAIVTADGHKAASCGFLLLSFLAGSTLCGAAIRSSVLSLGLATYGTTLLCVSLFLLFSRLCGATLAGAYFAAAAMGIQNGIFTLFSGAVMRTTHVTGILTDLGLLLGRLSTRRLRHVFFTALSPAERAEEKDELRRMELLVPLYVCFVLGGASPVSWGSACATAVLTHYRCRHLLSAAGAGGVLQQAIGIDAILVSAGLCAMLGLAYASFRVVLGRQAEGRQAEAEAPLPASDVEMTESETRGKALLRGAGLIAGVSRHHTYEALGDEEEEEPRASASAPTE
jgi:uncharacterized membrane protein YoaK (UPF0700 family)